MSLEQDQKRQYESLQRIYKAYGQDETKWDWHVLAKFRCRIRRGEGFLANELKANLELGTQTCPINRKVKTIVTPHPAGNVSGVIAANNFPDKCALCGLTPTSSNFDIE